MGRPSVTHSPTTPASHMPAIAQIRNQAAQNAYITSTQVPTDMIDAVSAELRDIIASGREDQTHVAAVPMQSALFVNWRWVIRAEVTHRRRSLEAPQLRHGTTTSTTALQSATTAQVQRTSGSSAQGTGSIAPPSQTGGGGLSGQLGSTYGTQTQGTQATTRTDTEAVSVDGPIAVQQEDYDVHVRWTVNTQVDSQAGISPMTMVAAAFVGDENHSGELDVGVGSTTHTDSTPTPQAPAHHGPRTPASPPRPQPAVSVLPQRH